METIIFPIMTAHDIECRPNKVTATSVNLLLYKDARVDMRILDTFIGPYDWQREHKELKGVIYCGVSLRHPKTGEWLTKWDAGKESKQEAEKGEASDSFKRACVNWGIGRELYTAPTIWVDLKQGETYTEKGNLYLSYNVKFSVSEIEYNKNREITLLVIVDQNGAERYRWENGKKKTARKPAPQPAAQPAPTPKAETQAEPQAEPHPLLKEIAGLDVVSAAHIAASYIEKCQTLDEIRALYKAIKDDKDLYSLVETKKKKKKQSIITQQTK